MLCVCPQFYIWFLTRRIDYILILLQWKKYSKKSLAIKLKNANPDSNPTGSGSVFSLDQVNLIIANTDPNVKKNIWIDRIRIVALRLVVIAGRGGSLQSGQLHLQNIPLCDQLCVVKRHIVKPLQQNA